MSKIYVGMLFGNYGQEFSSYDKYSPSHKGVFRQGRVTTTSDKTVKETNCFNVQNLSFEEMLTDKNTIKFDYERDCKGNDIFSMQRGCLKYSGENHFGDNYRNDFTRIDSPDSYAVDLNKNGKVDKGEIFYKNESDKDIDRFRRIKDKMEEDLRGVDLSKLPFDNNYNKPPKPIHGPAHDPEPGFGKIIPLDSELGRELNRQTLELRPMI